ncbi:MAG: tetratricopeptide repeat protein [Segetibacter sp.]
MHRADSIARGTGNQELRAYVLLKMGDVNRLGSNNHQALAYEKEAEAIALKTGNKKLLFECQSAISTIYGSSLNDFPKAIEYGLKAVASAEEANCQSCLVTGWTNLARDYTFASDQSNGLIYYLKALEANKQIGDRNQEVRLNNYIGERYRLMGKYTEAIRSYNKVLAGAKSP